MKKTYTILAFSTILLILLMLFLFIKKNKPSFMTGSEVIYLDNSSFVTAKVEIGEYLTYEEYQAHKNPTTVEKVEHTVINGREVEVVYLGPIGVLGEKLDITYIDTETHLDEDRYIEYMSKKEDPIKNSEDVASSENAQNEDSSSEANQNNNDDADNSNDNQDDNNDSDNPSDDDTNNADNQDDDADNQDDDSNNSDDSSSQTDNNKKDEDPEDNTTDEAKTPDDTENNAETEGIIRTSAVREYVRPENSVQNLGYVVYAPENVTANTPVFLYLHGIGQNGDTYKKFIGELTFLKYLVNGNWTPNCVFVAPILPGGTKWINQTSNIDKLLTEVVNTYGGSRSNMYIGGFSAGCDSITPIAQSINFKGALYMAGYLGAVGNTIDYTTFLKLWSGKKAYYFRDSQYGGGGYGYVSSYVKACENNAAAYGVDFKHIDMNWVHRSTMVDAVLLPPYFTDLNGDSCRDMLSFLLN